MTIEITDHFRERFTQRIAKTRRIVQFASRAAQYGTSTDQIKNASLRKELTAQENDFGSIAKIYKNNVYWFSGDRAVTVYALPQKYHGKF